MSTMRIDVVTTEWFYCFVIGFSLNNFFFLSFSLFNFVTIFNAKTKAQNFYIKWQSKLFQEMFPRSMQEITHRCTSFLLTETIYRLIINSKWESIFSSLLTVKYRSCNKGKKKISSFLIDLEANKPKMLFAS